MSAIEPLVWMIGWGAGKIRVPVYLDAALAPSTWLDGTPAAVAGELARRAERWDFERSAQVEIGMPARRGGACSVLWCWLNTPDSAARAARWRTRLPSLVLRMGGSSRRLAFWAMEEMVAGVSVEAANRRLAYALRAPQKWALPDSLRIPVPGTFLRVGRVRPSPVLVSRLVDDVYGRAQLVGRLKDPPPKDAWKERK